MHGFFLRTSKSTQPPLAGADVERGVKVHVTGDVGNRVASGVAVPRLARFLLLEIDFRAFAGFGHCIRCSPANSRSNGPP
jgi:hypothetical protein